MLRVIIFCVAIGLIGSSISNAFAAEGAVKAPDYEFKSAPQPLSGLKDVHPRLYITADRAAALKKLVVDDKDYARMFAEVQVIADRAVKDGPRQYVVDDGWSDTEQLWQREVGEVMPGLAMSYLMTGEKRYLESAKAWMLTSLDYKTWGQGIFDGKDLAAGHQLYGIALAYDWLYNDLDEPTRKEIRDKLVKRARVDYDAAVTKEIYWADSYLQNHLWVNITGIAAVGFALYGEADGIDGFINMPREKYGKTFALLGDDGASFEGVPYWGYGVEYILKFADLSRDLLGEDLLKGSEWFRQTAYFRLYSSLPRNSWTKKTNLMSFGDSPRFDWYGPDYLLRKLAAEYNDGHAQWLANAVDEAGINHPVAQFLNLIWYDPKIAPVAPSDLPTFKHFTDLGLVFMRTGWSGDETLAAFKCGPHVGFKALKMLSDDPGSGHVHPDEGAFQIFAFGEALIADDSYTMKTTAYQNTLTVNGVGQEGEGFAWFRGDTLCKSKRAARIIAAKSTGEMDYVIGDVTEAYSVKAGLTKFVRSFYFLKPSTWVVVDEVEAAQPSTFDLYFHSDYPFVKTESGSFEAKGTKASITVTALMPADVTARAFKQDLKDPGGKPMAKPLDALTVTNGEKTKKTTFVHVLYACPAGSDGRAVSSISKIDNKTILTVKTPDREWRFKMDLERAQASMPVLVEEGGK